MKKLFAILLVVAMTLSALCFVACDKKNATNLNFKYSDYYKQSIYFEEYKPLLEKYLTIVQKAYDGSDKKTVSTFNLDAEYDTVLGDLLGVLSKSASGNADDLEAFLKATEARKKVGDMVGDIVARVATIKLNTPETVDEELFKNLNNSIDKIMNELANGKA